MSYFISTEDLVYYSPEFKELLNERNLIDDRIRNSITWERSYFFGPSHAMTSIDYSFIQELNKYFGPLYRFDTWRDLSLKVQFDHPKELDPYIKELFHYLFRICFGYIKGNQWEFRRELKEYLQSL